MIIPGIFVLLTIAANARGCAPVHPKVKGSPVVIGILSDDSLNRDSCGSTMFGSRALWVCRDTQPSGATLPIICSSASWTNPLPGGKGGTELNMYGDNQWKSFYPLVDGNCNGNEAGACEDGTRFPHWPDSPPLLVYDDGEVAVGYTWVPNSHITGLDPIIRDPSTSLYRVTHRFANQPGKLPKVELIDPGFWAEGDIPYGRYGGVVRDSFAYLYGQGSDWKVALARVPLAKIEEKASYEFWVGGNWTRSKPNLGDAAIENVSAGGQGTYYFSQHWNSFVWIGQAAYSVEAEFFITTAPNPTGPWIKPEHFYSGVNGNASLPAYSIQAHPGLSDPQVNEIYLTYTKVDDVYTTPLIRVEWE